MSTRDVVSGRVRRCRRRRSKGTDRLSAVYSRAYARVSTGGTEDESGPREEEKRATDVKPWQMTVESGRRRRLGIVLLYKSTFLLTRDVENARRGTVRRRSKGQLSLALALSGCRVGVDKRLAHVDRELYVRSSGSPSLLVYALLDSAPRSTCARRRVNFRSHPHISGNSDHVLTPTSLDMSARYKKSCD